MKQVAIVSDTHVPSREPALPGWVEREIRAADHAIHAGDFDTLEAYEAVRGLAAGLTAVAGNNDPGSLGLPRVASVRVEGVEFVVTHGIGTGRGHRDRVAGRVAENAGTDAAVGVSGHSHRTHDTVVDGVRLLNPGSCTGAWPSARATMMVAEVDGTAVDVGVLDGSSG